ncbi:ras-interacting protein RIP3 isoform X1 [Hyalella azteca]|uniref:Ras-interacting protein RIP3 isoform X1 n=1 Tax=Hyalella azteca TaxID=294128 RepID=A0A979FN12_HYAAZ|nr:ras-interacting protein RIP3 isoform X1 [Hyalella azteca]
MSIEGRGKRPYKVWDSGRTVRKGIVVSTFTELVEKGREKLELGDVRVRVVLEADGTHVDDAEYFSSLPENTVFLLLRQGEHWYPAGVEAIRQASPRKPAGTARVIVSGIGENAVQRHHEALTSHAVLSTTPSITTGTPGGMVHGTVTTILRDGKKETIINDVGSLHQGALVNHDGEHKTTFIGRLSRQGSSVESGHSAIHVHTPECCTRGHPTPVLPTRASPTGEQQECDFHCCTLHEETSRLPGRDRHHHHHHHQQQQTSQHPSSQQVRIPLSPLVLQQQQKQHHQLSITTPSRAALSPLLALEHQLDNEPFGVISPSPQAHSPCYPTSPSSPLHVITSSSPPPPSLPSPHSKSSSSSPQLHTPHTYSPLTLQAQKSTAIKTLQIPSQPQKRVQRSTSKSPSPSIRVQIHSQSLQIPSHPHPHHQQSLPLEVHQASGSHQRFPSDASQSSRSASQHAQTKVTSSQQMSLTAQQKHQHLQQLQEQLHQQQLELQQIEIHHQQQQLEKQQQKCRIHDQPCNCC